MEKNRDSANSSEILELLERKSSLVEQVEKNKQWYKEGNKQSVVQGIVWPAQRDYVGSSERDEEATAETVKTMGGV